MDNVIKPYVQDNNFIIVLDSWDGQTNAASSKKFDEFGSSCTLQVISKGCTPYAQPCDVYFFRQVKLLVKRLQNATVL